MNTQSNSFPPIESVIPHRTPMILIDRIVAREEEALTSETTFDGDHLFANANSQIPSYVGIELMAQTIAAYAGMQAYDKQEPAKIGLLLGTRKYSCDRPFFDSQCVLQTHIKHVLSDGIMGFFSCKILVNNAIIAQAELKAIQPDDAKTFFQS